MDEIIHEYIKNQMDVLTKIDSYKKEILEIYSTFNTAREKGNKMFVMGNGGSASTASHFVSDLLKTSITIQQKRFKAISLCDNIPVILAWANDSSFEDIFVGQLENFLDENDIVVGISGSGNSKNVIKAIEFANKNNNQTISLTGRDGGKLSQISKINITIPSEDMLTIESFHLMICHLLTSLFRKSGTPLFTY